MDLEKYKDLPTAEEVLENPELLTPEVLESAKEMVQDFSNWASAFMGWVKENAESVLEKLVLFATSVQGIQYQGYLDNGAIYGDTDEGFKRWLEDVEHYSQNKAIVERALTDEFLLKGVIPDELIPSCLSRLGLTRTEWHVKLVDISYRN